MSSRGHTRSAASAADGRACQRSRDNPTNALPNGTSPCNRHPHSADPNAGETATSPPVGKNACSNESVCSPQSLVNVPSCGDKKWKRCKLKDFGVGQLTRHNLLQVKMLCQASLKIKLEDRIYDSLPSHVEFSRVGYIGDVMVGAICCRVEPLDNFKRLYIISLSVLKPYRRLGIGSELLAYVMTKASARKDLRQVYTHEWVENCVGLEFLRYFEFSLGDRIDGHYANDNVEPPDCYVMTRELPWKSPVTSKDGVGTTNSKCDMSHYNLPVL